MSKPRSTAILTEWKLSIPASLASRVDLLLLNPLTNKPRYGERSKITALFWETYLSQMSAREAPNGTMILPLPNIPEALFVINGKSFTFDELASAVNAEEKAA